MNVLKTLRCLITALPPNARDVREVYIRSMQRHHCRNIVFVPRIGEREDHLLDRAFVTLALLCKCGRSDYRSQQHTQKLDVSLHSNLPLERTADSTSEIISPQRKPSARLSR
jgi:hypothetical protein